MASRDHQSTIPAARAQSQIDSMSSSTPVEMSQLDAHHQQLDEPVSPMSPGAEDFSTPPQSARHSTLGTAYPGIAALRDEEQSAAGAEQVSQEIGVAKTTPDEAPARAEVAEGGPQISPKEPQGERRDSPVSPIQPTTTDRPAIGPATSQSQLPTTLTSQEPAEPSLQLVLLRQTGQRHPFTISESYLQKRGISSAKAAAKKGSHTLDPYGISGYTLKELIWRDWRDEWESRPSSPGGIRLISLGKLVDDNKPLSDYFSADREATMSNHVVHLAVKPPDFDDDDGTHKKGRNATDDGEGRARCCGCCSVM